MRLHIFMICYLVYISQARDIYEEAIQTVITVRDFTQVYDAYAQFEKSMTTARMETVADLGATEEGTDILSPIQGWHCCY